MVFRGRPEVGGLHKEVWYMELAIYANGSRSQQEWQKLQA